MNKKIIHVLGIETSCDDTSISIIAKDNEKVEVLYHNKFSQDLLLQKWGGVVPEIAARNHLAKITPLLDECFKGASMHPKDMDVIGVTVKPGLLGPLLTGLNAAKSISLLYEIPIVAVNHLYAHLEAIHLSQKIPYPYFGVLVSGGHTMFFLVKSSTQFELVASTIDDASGEAFDKAGKIMGLGYPAGHLVDRYAKWGDENRFEFPVSMKKDPSLNMSFSGIKTAIRVFVEKNISEFSTYPESDTRDDSRQYLYDTCASFQKAVVETIIFKLKKAHQQIDSKLPIVVGGGVACNSKLRFEIAKNFKNSFFVEPKYCTDNGAMIANLALINYKQAISFPKCLELDAAGKFQD